HPDLAYLTDRTDPAVLVDYFHVRHLRAPDAARVVQPFVAADIDGPDGLSGSKTLVDAFRSENFDPAPLEPRRTYCAAVIKGFEAGEISGPLIVCLKQSLHLRRHTEKVVDLVAPDEVERHFCGDPLHENGHTAAEQALRK